jgi:uncharacterized membrane protein
MSDERLFMGHAHAHTPSGTDGGTGSRLQVDRTTRAALIAVVVLTALVTLGGLLWLWPRGPLPHNAAVGTVTQDSIAATVVGVSRRTCPGTSDDRLADGSVAPTVRCATVRARLDDGTNAGRTVTVEVTGPTVDEGLAPGVRAVVARFPDATAGGGDVYAWVDFDRGQSMWVLVVVFVLVVVAVARLRGLAALVGVGVGFAMVLVFLLPALRRGENPVAVTLVGSVAVMLVVLYASHGISAKTTSALIGTVTALATTAGLAAWAASAAHLNGQTGEDALSLSQLVGAQTVSAAVVSGMVLAGLGVLNDVTVTQASAVWELKTVAPHLGVAGLAGRAMRIGRDHLASTVYTLAFVYAGVALPVLLLIQVYDRPFTEVITSAPIAQDVVGALVAGIGIALAVPFTTAIAALVAARARPAAAEHWASASVPVHATEPEEAAVPKAPTGQPEESFEQGLLFRRRRPGVDRPRPSEDDQLEVDATDWSSWPT